MTLPDLTRNLLWYVFWGLAAWDVYVLSIPRYDATISSVLAKWNQESDGLPAAILFGLWAHAFWANR